MAFDDLDRKRLPYIAREIFKTPPVELSTLASLDANRLSTDWGKLFYPDDRMTSFHGELRRRNVVALQFPLEFTRQYGELTSMTKDSRLIAIALVQLGIPPDKFSVGYAFKPSPDNEAIGIFLFMDKDAYRQMAKKALQTLADKKGGADIGLKNAERYRHALEDPQSDASKVVDTLLEHGGLSARELVALHNNEENEAFREHVRQAQQRQRGRRRS